jgi:hypothetical protein
MATRIDNAVTLGHVDAEIIAKMLGDLATHYAGTARRSRSAPVREMSAKWAVEARRQAEAITKQLWSWL